MACRANLSSPCCIRMQHLEKYCMVDRNQIGIGAHLRSETGVTGMSGMNTRQRPPSEPCVRMGVGSNRDDSRDSSSGMGLTEGKSGSVMVLRGVAQSDSVSCNYANTHAFPAYSQILLHSVL